MSITKNNTIESPVMVNGNGLGRNDHVNGYSASNGSDTRHSEWEAARKIEQTIAYMRNHLDKPLQVATLASLANVSPSHYFALFKRQTGSAPIDYFTRLRMEQACRLLYETALSVKEIATTLGYEDPFYFSRVFKSVNRIAPTEYRATHKNSSNGAATVNGSRPGAANTLKAVYLERRQNGILPPNRKDTDGRWKTAVRMFAAQPA